MGSEEFVVLMFAAPHPPQRAGMQDEVGRHGPVNRSCLGYDAGDCLACVWVAIDVAFSDGFIWYISEHVPAQGRADYSVVDHLRWFVCRVEGDYGQLVRCPPLPHDGGHVTLCFCVDLEEAGDVVPAEVKGFDARRRARDAPHGASGQLQGQAPQGTHPLSHLVPVVLPLHRQDVQHLLCDSCIKTFEGLARMLQSEEPLEVDGPLVDAHP